MRLWNMTPFKSHGDRQRRQQALKANRCQIWKGRKTEGEQEIKNEMLGVGVGGGGGLLKGIKMTQKIILMLATAASSQEQ